MRNILLVSGALSAALAVVFACGADGGSSFRDPDGDAGLDGGSGGPGLFGGDDGGEVGPFTDFPEPIVEVPDGGAGLPSDVVARFGADPGGEGAGPCLVEPEPGTLYPKNWLRPRFQWTVAGDHGVFELRLHADNQTRDLLVYTTSTTWTMPKPMWDALRLHSADVPMRVSVRSASWDGTTLSPIALGSNGELGIAPVEAPGSVVFWSIGGGGDEGSILKGFTVGDEGVVNVLSKRQHQQTNGGEGVHCVGCHTSTPDGKVLGVGLEIDKPGGAHGNDGFSTSVVELTGDAGAVPSFLGAAARDYLAAAEKPLISFSKAHFTAGDRRAVTTADGKLVWVDLEAAASGSVSGLIAVNGDPNAAALGPSFSPDGTRIAYMSGAFPAHAADWRGPSDLYVVPYNDGAGGTAQPLAGANDPNKAEYYPAFSPDNALIAFTRAPDNGRIYDRAEAEILVVPAGGGEATRLLANDVPECATKKTGLANSWPKWSPEVREDKGRKFMWLVFSSRRNGSSAQLFIAPLVSENGALRSYHALYLWNQQPNVGNHTPAWDYTALPPAGPN